MGVSVVFFAGVAAMREFFLDPSVVASVIVLAFGIISCIIINIVYAEHKYLVDNNKRSTDGEHPSSDEAAFAETKIETIKHRFIRTRKRFYLTYMVHVTVVTIYIVFAAILGTNADIGQQNKPLVVNGNIITYIVFLSLYFAFSHIWSIRLWFLGLTAGDFRYGPESKMKKEAGGIGIPAERTINVTGSVDTLVN
ncbi:MAG: hypothetical protein H7840_05770 [Alphaproteobacteria bacterium]